MTALLNPSDFPALYAFDISHWLLTVFPVPWFSTLATGADRGGFGEGFVLGARAPGLALFPPAPALSLGLVATACSGTPPLLEAVAVGAGAGDVELLRRGGVLLRYALRP